MAFVCTIINILYPCIMPLDIPDKPISHFNKSPRIFYAYDKRFSCQLKPTGIQEHTQAFLQKIFASH